MRLKHVVPVLGAALLLGTSVASAQNCGFTGPTASCPVATTVTATVPIVATVTLNAINTSFNPIALADFNTGYKFATGPSAEVKANAAWTLSVSSNASTFDAAPWSKPAADLTWATTGNTPATAMSTSAATLMSGVATNGDSEGIDYRWKLTFADDVPGSYSMTVNFTLTAP